MEVLPVGTRLPRKRYRLKEERVMKRYENPEFDLITVAECDVITTSPGTEMPVYPETGEIWDLDINQ